MNDSDRCQTSTVLVVGRWDYRASDPVSNRNTIALHCVPHIHLQNFSITFDQRWQIQSSTPVAGTAIITGAMFNNATVSLEQCNKGFAAIPQRFVGNTSAHNGAYNISSYDWAGFLVARLYQRSDPEPRSTPVVSYK